MIYTISDVFVAGEYLSNCAKYFAPKFYPVEEDTKNQYEKMCSLYSQGKPFPVSSINCVNIIYPTNEDNIIFRAWHDMMHFITDKSFNPSCEPSVYRAQKMQLAQWYFSRFSDEKLFKLLALVLESETVGQVSYEQENEKFPENQVEFCLKWINNKFRYNYIL